MSGASRKRLLAILIALSLLPACSSLSSKGSLKGSLLITNVNVITGEGGDVLENHTVLINNNKIVAISSMDKVKSMQSANIIDAQNAYLLPGFIDTHAHIGVGPVGVRVEEEKPIVFTTPSTSIAEHTLRSLIKYGITTARDPGGDVDITVTSKRRVENGEISGPRLFVAGNIIDTEIFEGLIATVKTPNDVRTEIRRQAASGVDWIKLYTGLSKDMVAVGIEEAHAQGVKVTGHLHKTNWKDASDLGIDSIVHIIPSSTELLPNDKHAEYEASIAQGLSILKWFEFVDYDSTKITNTIKSLRDNNVSIDPTLIVFHAMAFGNKDIYLKNPALKDASPELIENWQTAFNFNLGWTQENFSYAQSVWPRVSEFVKRLHDSGVSLTAGSDANNPWAVPGDSFHKELELLVDAGISERDVITIATRNGAELLGVLDQVGTISLNKQADLVLIKSNPYDDISSTRDIVWVMQNGKIQ